MGAALYNFNHFKHTYDNNIQKRHDGRGSVQIARIPDMQYSENARGGKPGPQPGAIKFRKCGINKPTLGGHFLNFEKNQLFINSPARRPNHRQEFPWRRGYAIPALKESEQERVFVYGILPLRQRVGNCANAHTQVKARKRYPKKQERAIINLYIVGLMKKKILLLIVAYMLFFSVIQSPGSSRYQDPGSNKPDSNNELDSGGELISIERSDINFVKKLTLDEMKRQPACPAPLPPPTLLEETGDMGQEYLDSIIFLGDSTTFGLLAYGVLSGGTESTQVWTPANRTFSLFNQSGILILYPETYENISVESAVSIKQPEYMIITLGINGVSMMDEESFKSDYIDLINRILGAGPDTKIMLNTIYPASQNYTLINNERIDMGNAWVYDIAVEMGLRYLDTASALKDADGFLPYEYQCGDGLHLSSDALNVVVGYIRTHGYK